jgi:hypothetical protein
MAADFAILADPRNLSGARRFYLGNVHAIEDRAELCRERIRALQREAAGFDALAGILKSHWSRDPSEWASMAGREVSSDVSRRGAVR